jgi:diacylglycerol O-acyltransferase / wax synthase
MPSSRLTSLDASFLEVESSTAHMHVGWAAAFSPPEGRWTPSFIELRNHVESRLGRAPRYRQKLAEVPLGVNDPVWVDDPDFDVRRHVRRARSSNFHEIVDDVMSSQLDRDRPLWELWIADRLDDGRIGVAGKAHHCMVDGIAAVELATLMLDTTPEPPPADSDGWRPASTPTGLRLLAEGTVDRFAQSIRPARLPLELALRPGRVRDLLRTGVSAVRAAGHTLAPAPPSALNAPISPRRHLASAQRSFADLRAIKRRHEASVNDVLLAAAAGGVRRLFEHRGESPAPLKTMVPVSVRDPDGAGELGNRISFVFVELPCHEPDPTRRFADVKTAMGERKRSGEPEGAQAILDAVGYAPRTLQQAVAHAAASPRAFNLVVSNIPGPLQPMYMLGCELEEVYPVVPLADRHAVSIGFTTVNDQAFFGVYADRDSLPEADELAGWIVDSLDELHDPSPPRRPRPRSRGGHRTRADGSPVASRR